MIIRGTKISASNRVHKQIRAMILHMRQCDHGEPAKPLGLNSSEGSVPSEDVPALRSDTKILFKG